MIFTDFFPDQLEVVPGYGSLDAEYMFIGASPALHYDKTSKRLPMGTSSINLISKMMQGHGTFYVTNLVKTRHDTRRKVPKNTVRKWYPKLLAEIKAVKPRRILAMGLEAAETLCPGFQNLQEDHGCLFWNPDLECVVVPTITFRQAQTSRRPQVKRDFFRDIERMMTLPDPKPAEIVYVESVKHLKELDIPADARVWLDIETTGLSFDDSITRVGWTWHPKKDCVYVLIDPDKEKLRALRNKLEEASVTVGHNFQFDLARVWNKSKTDWLLPVNDTMTRAHVMGERGIEDKTGSLSLKHLTTKYTDRPGPHAFGTRRSTGEALDQYLAEDVLSTRDLWFWQEQRLEKDRPYILRVIDYLEPIMVGMQLRGVYVDRPLLISLFTTYEGYVKKHLRKLKKYADINWDSQPEVAATLSDRGVPLSVTEKGNYSVAEAVLLKIKEQHPIAQLILDYRAALKDYQFLLSYLTMTSDEDPFLRPRLMLATTETGRLSCRDPNLQQVPRIGPIKTVYKSRWHAIGGKFGLCDLSQAELRGIAHLSADPLLVKALLAEDVHRSIAAIVFGIPEDQVTKTQRKKSKGVTFGLAYGGGDEGLAQRVGVPTSEVTEVRVKILGAFKRMAAWIDEQHRLARKTSKSKTLFGRTRDLSELIRMEGANSAFRKAQNTPVQSLASDIDLILLYGVATMCLGLGLKSRPILGVHDSLLFDIYPGEERMLAECMLEAFQALNDTPLNTLPLWDRLPFAGEFVVGESWAAVESTNEGFNPERIYPLDSRETTVLCSDQKARANAKEAYEEKLAEGA